MHIVVETCVYDMLQYPAGKALLPGAEGEAEALEREAVYTDLIALVQRLAADGSPTALSHLQV